MRPPWPPCLLSGPYPPVIGSICGPPKVRTPTELAAVAPRIPTPAWPGAPAFTLPVGEVVSAPFAWPPSSLVGEPRGIGISNPDGCISAPELPTSSLDHPTRVTHALRVSRSSATMRKFRLTTTACASCASTYALGHAYVAMPIKLAKTRKSKPNYNSHLTSLQPLFHAIHENKQSKLSGYLSAAVPCCFVSLILVDMHRAGASNSKVKSSILWGKIRPCKRCLK